jgi:hypothetical protein
VLGGADLKCCSNGTIPGSSPPQAEVWASDTVSNPACCGQIVYNDEQDQCCDLQSREGLANPFSTGEGIGMNQGLITRYRTTEWQLGD